MLRFSKSICKRVGGWRKPGSGQAFRRLRSCSFMPTERSLGEGHPVACELYVPLTIATEHMESAPIRVPALSEADGEGIWGWRGRAGGVGLVVRCWCCRYARLDPAGGRGLANPRRAMPRGLHDADAGHPGWSREMLQSCAPGRHPCLPVPPPGALLCISPPRINRKLGPVSVNEARVSKRDAAPTGLFRTCSPGAEAAWRFRRPVIWGGLGKQSGSSGNHDSAFSVHEDPILHMYMPDGGTDCKTWRFSEDMA
jgi:hypothetical protein